MILLLVLATLALGDPLPNGQAPSTTDQYYDVVWQMKDAVRNAGRDQHAVADAVKTCTKDGRQGECVQAHLCDSNDTITVDGAVQIQSQAVIDFKVLGECNNYMEKCCFLLKRETPRPEIREGCGWSNPNGVGFSIKQSYDGETNFGEFPWTVALQKKSSEFVMMGKPLYKYIGGGSLIHRHVVLTAAHYVFGESAENFMVRAGEWDYTSKSEPYPYQDREVREVVAHSNFSKQTAVNDVALLFLASPIELAPNVGVACLAATGARAAAGTRCVAAGWGKKSLDGGMANVLKRVKLVELPVVDHAQCEMEFRRSPLGRHYELHDSFMCAGGGGKDMCKGDGGAPLVCPSSQPNRYIQHGIVSWGVGCYAYPGVNSAVGHLRGWIDDTVRSRGLDPSVYTLDLRVV